MKTIIRRSPAILPAKPLKTEIRMGWEVVLKYEEESEQIPSLVDLSHRSKWSIQGKDLGSVLRAAFPLPDAPGNGLWKDGVFIGRVSFKQVFLWDLRPRGTGVAGMGEPETAVLRSPAATDVTDVSVMLGISGSNVLRIAEKLTSMDLGDPGKEAPFVLQGPFSHVPSQVVVLQRTGADGAFIVACSRGYAHDMVHALMDAGEEFGLRPAGEGWFTAFVPQGVGKVQGREIEGRADVG